MKIGIYTDAHCAYTSSILPLHCTDSKYTTRLQMIIDTFRWMYDTFRSHGVDCIVNCGDLFDSFRVRAEELSALSEALSYSYGTAEFHVIGNHEVMDKQRNFYATALLSNYPHIEIINTPTKYDNGLSFLPYMTADEAEDVIPFISNKILFSHVDIQGSWVTPQYALETGVSPTSMGSYFQLVLNGHLHSPQSLNAVVHNIGACTSLSFSDNSDYTPRVCILDTDTLQMEYIENPYAIRFRKINSGIDALRSHIADSTRENLEVVRITVPASRRKEAEEMILNDTKIIAHRITTEVEKVDAGEASMMPDELSLDLNENVFSKFVDFLKTSPDLSYPLENYLSVVAELTKEESTQ